MPKDINKLLASNSKGFTANGRKYTSRSGLKESDASGPVEIRDHTDEILAKLDEAVARAVIVYTQLSRSKEKCRVSRKHSAADARIYSFSSGNALFRNLQMGGFERYELCPNDL